MLHLQPNSTLQGGKYRIERVLGQGGFGITYLAENTMLDGKVAIKEFFFKEYCGRDEDSSHVTIGTSGNREIVERFKAKFIKEARTIFQLNHPNIIRILDIFEENGTAYYVMEYIEGESLNDMVKRRGYIPEAEAVGYIHEVGSALSYIHSRSMNHLDIKPGNIMKRREDGKIVVIDFGVAKQYDKMTSEGTTTTPVGISKGYSPNEQYVLSGVQSFSPQSDVYALAATLFKLLTGNTPPEAAIVLDEGLPVAELKDKGVSQSIISAIDMAMQSKSRRTQNVDAFMSALTGGKATDTSTDASQDETTSFIDLEKLAWEKRLEESRCQSMLKAERQKALEAEKAKTEALAKVEPEHKAREEKARKRTEEKKTRKTAQKSGSKNTWLGGVIGVIVVAGIITGIIIGVNSKGDSSANGNTVQSWSAIQSGNNASYNNGVLNVDDITYDMVKVQAGTFIMGATSEMIDPFYDEEPTHQVTLTNDYYIGKTEVTQALWKAVMGNNPSDFKGDNLPVECVSWDDCQKFISKLSSMTGQNFRLPTEAEWEFAARGGNNSKHYQYSGNNNLDDVAWYDRNSGNMTHPVATKQPNELGIYDMSGNVWEWCSDWYGYYSSNSQTDPTGPSNGSNRVDRGGSWNYLARYCRSSYRYIFTPFNVSDNNLGLRLALSL